MIPISVQIRSYCSCLLLQTIVKLVSLKISDLLSLKSFLEPCLHMLSVVLCKREESINGRINSNGGDEPGLGLVSCVRASCHNKFDLRICKFTLSSFHSHCWTKALYFVSPVKNLLRISQSRAICTFHFMWTTFRGIVPSGHSCNP